MQNEGVCILNTNNNIIIIIVTRSIRIGIIWTFSDKNAAVSASQYCKRKRKKNKEGKNQIKLLKSNQHLQITKTKEEQELMINIQTATSKFLADLLYVYIIYIYYIIYLLSQEVVCSRVYGD